MCGIVGFFGKGTSEDIMDMTRTLNHRGPDETGLYEDSRLPLHLGHTRLSIRDISGGKQPMKSREEDIIVVYNGQIYNERELRAELESCGHVFQTHHSDTEILIHAYRQWREKMVDRFNGMWAFALFDRKEQKLFLSRDRFGKKPLYFTIQDDIFAFSSELKAFSKHQFLNLSISPKGLQKYHAHGYFPGEWTLYKEVRKLPGGCNMVIDLKNFQAKVTRYWSYKIEPEYGKKEEYWTNEVCKHLRDAVQRRLVSDVPLGIFLSGGLDSSIVAYFAQEKPGSIPLESFSVRFLDSSFDETPSATLMARFAGTRHTVIPFSADLLPDIRQEVFSQLDEPLSDSSMLSYYLLCREARKRITVALGGDAGDELFAGYDTFRALKISQMIQHFLPKPCHQGILALLSKLPVSHGYMNFKFRLERLLKSHQQPASLWNPLWLSPMPLEEIIAITNEPVTLEELYSEAIELWDKTKAVDFVDKSLEFYGNLFLQDQILVKVDRMSMLRSLEVRAPLLDINLINCARRIPSNLKLKGNQTKYILKKSVASLLPPEIVWRKKIGFSAPLSRWFSDGSLSLQPNQYWNDAAQKLIHQKIHDHTTHQADNRLPLWNCYVLNEVTGRMYNQDLVQV